MPCERLFPRVPITLAGEAAIKTEPIGFIQRIKKTLSAWLDAKFTHCRPCSLGVVIQSISKYPGFEVSMIPAGLSILFLLWVGSAAKAQVRPSNVTAARLENIAAVPDRSGIRFDVRNIGQRAITAFFVEFSQQGANGESIPCGGRGVDMIDWSDPMPARNIYVHMRRNWISPGGKTSIDGYPQCPNAAASLEQTNVQLSLIMFDDGTGEGDPARIESTLFLRQQARDERLKWLSRFTVLLNTPDLRVSAQSLYQDLVDATRSAEIDPHAASRQGMAKPIRDELQRLALDITQLAAHNGQLQQNEFVVWRITDLEQRTARLVKGAGNTDVIPK